MSAFVQATVARAALVMAWVIATCALLSIVPAYHGETGSRAGRLMYVVAIGVIAVGALYRSVPTRHAAVRSAWPALTLVVAALVCGYLVKRSDEGARGEPLYLYLGVTLLVSWACLVVATAFLTRTRWTTAAALAVTLVIAFLGFSDMTMRID